MVGTHHKEVFFIFISTSITDIDLETSYMLAGVLNFFFQYKTSLILLSLAFVNTLFTFG
jgi:hypothetical protein